MFSQPASRSTRAASQQKPATSAQGKPVEQLQSGPLADDTDSTLFRKNLTVQLKSCHVSHLKACKCAANWQHAGQRLLLSRQNAAARWQHTGQQVLHNQQTQHSQPPAGGRRAITTRKLKYRFAHTAPQHIHACPLQHRKGACMWPRRAAGPSKADALLARHADALCPVCSATQALQ